MFLTYRFITLWRCVSVSAQLKIASLLTLQKSRHLTHAFMVLRSVRQLSMRYWKSIWTGVSVTYITSSTGHKQRLVIVSVLHYYAKQSVAFSSSVVSYFSTWKFFSFFSTMYLRMSRTEIILTLILLSWTIWRAPTNASKWRMGFNSAFKGLT